MNIIIPLCGKGERFLNKYSKPKPLIKVFDKEIIFYIIDNIININCEKNIYIIINKNTNNINLIEIITAKLKEKNKLHSSNINFIDIIDETRGAAETILLGLYKIQKNFNLNYNNLLIVDGDNFYTNDFINTINLNYNSILYFKDDSKIEQYSYIKLDNDSTVIDIIEKKKISNNANTGVYYFNNISDFIYNCELVIKNNIMFNNEFYVSVIIKYMLNNNNIFKGIEIMKENYISLGTPLLVDQYIKNTYAFLFDLDGTLIISDHIYEKAWNNILKLYNIYVDQEFFKLHIQGNSDYNVINKLLPNLNIDIDSISKLKDEYFNEFINEIKIIDGAIDFIKKIKLLGHKVAIVTNCNRTTATNIINYFKIEDIVDLLIIGNECKRSKPYPDPYLEAIDYFNIKNNNYFIFEDSDSGLLSAKSANPKCIIGIDYFNNNLNNIIKNGANIVINNFIDDSNNNLLDKILNYNVISNNEKLKIYIRELLEKKYDLHDIIIHSDILKGGYISDVIKIDIILKNNKILKTIFKKENKNENGLSYMVDNLNLYEREYYLYENIYPYLNLRTPKFYGTVRDNNLDRLGILLENLNTDDFVLNLDMNKTKIEIILIYVKSIAKMHCKFYDKNLINKFKGLHRQNSKELNNEFICNFINVNIDFFIKKWKFLLDENLIEILNLINSKYSKIQNKLSTGLLTLCHGDFKSPNIFCKIDKENYEPYIIDWQYICEGKGIQDIIFFMIESFDSNIIEKYFNIIIDYYYNELIEFGIENYTEYKDDITYSICYFPMLVSIWFGTIDNEKLIDKNFPFIFIKKFLFFLNNYINKELLNNL
jgi:HAD superfamily hydrolase (TIGR01509 family)